MIQCKCKINCGIHTVLLVHLLQWYKRQCVGKTLPHVILAHRCGACPAQYTYPAVNMPALLSICLPYCQYACPIVDTPASCWYICPIVDTPALLSICPSHCWYTYPIINPIVNMPIPLSICLTYCQYICLLLIYPVNMPTLQSIHSPPVDTSVALLIQLCLLLLLWAMVL